VPLVAAAFLGVKAAVLAVVIEALLRIAKRALKAEFAYLLAAAAFLAIFVFDLPFPLVVIAAGLIGYVIGARRPSLLGLAPAVATGAVIAPGQARRTIATALLWLAVWLVPVALLHVALGGDHVFAAIARFFSVMAVVTFGGAYAVLAYVAQQAVEVYGWLTATEMIDGLGLAETTPGPLILVNQFVGFLAGFRALTGIDPWLAGALGAATTIYVTFVPSFLWIFAGAPYIEALRGRPALSGALAAITAAVVGVILNLALWFALHVVFGVVHERAWPELGIALAWPDWGSLQPFVLGLALASMVAMFGLKIGMLPTLALAAAAGIASYFLA
jgi:chromate transporter